MRILYGVQATGQGHISRARAMAKALAGYDVQVDWLFSGRARNKLFDMEPFGNFMHRRGLSFATRAGKVSYLHTVLSQNIFQFISEVRGLDVTPYDLIVTDYEPVTAWAGRSAGVRTIGIGHQYAFGPGTPNTGGNWLTHGIMRSFAPVALPLGLHWHPYSGNVLPPILDLPDQPGSQREHILVYLPFEDQDLVTRFLQQFPQQQFKQYSADVTDGEHGNVMRQRANISGFKADLWACRGVICNSGFELVSECLQWHKPVLTKPLAGQMEQLSNALALQQLGYAQTMHDLDPQLLSNWLASTRHAPTLRFPDVAAALAQWLAGGAMGSPEMLARGMWQQPWEQPVDEVRCVTSPATGQPSFAL